MFKNILFILALCAGPILQAQTHTLDSTVLTERTVVDSIDIPWEIIWGPDDHIWMTERFGRVSRVDPQSGQRETLLDISAQVYEQSETGLLGMALHPDFPNTPHVFLAYTYLDNSNIEERIVRYTYSSNSLNSPMTLLENIEGNTTHVGCRLLFLSDTTLLVTTGDAQQQSLPQNTSSIVGKVLRMTVTGAIPADNPIPGSYVWSWGHRNAQGLCLAPNGRIYSSEHGPTTDDELNLLEPARNYGWPDVHGYCDNPGEQTFCADSNVIEPLAAWTPTIATSDIAWYSHPAIPEFQDKLLMTVLKNQRVVAFGFNAAGDSVLTEDHYFANDFGRLRDVCVSPDGAIYLATNGTSWSNTNPFTHRIVELKNLNFTTTTTKIPAKQEVKVFPNPVQSGAEIQLSGTSELPQQLQIYDIMGRLVFSKNINNTKIPMPLDTGIYIYQMLWESGQQQTGKLIVQ